MRDAIQEVVARYMNSAKLTDFQEGEVITPPPELTIRVADRRSPIPKELLTIAESLTRHTRIVTLTHMECQPRDLGDGTEQDFLDTDDLLPPYTYYQHNNIELTFQDVLKKGDKILVARAMGGQRYVILDRIVTY